MSRGLGSLQRHILGHLVGRAGGDVVKDSGDWRIRLGPGIHDLRQVSQAMARQHGGISHAHFVSCSWQASFSRAVRGLETRGLVKVLSTVPVLSAESGARLFHLIHDLAGGRYLVLSSRQRRFARVLPESARYA